MPEDVNFYAETAEKIFKIPQNQLQPWQIRYAKRVLFGIGYGGKLKENDDEAN